MQWLKGLIFLIIAIASLSIVLLWPHKGYTNTRYTDTVEPLNFVIKTYGLPMPWIEVQDSGYYTSVEKDIASNQKNTKYDEKHLLIDLITWAIFLTLVTFGFKAINRATRS